MTHVNDKADPITIAYIGGGSREWAWKLMSDLALEESLSGEVRLYDIDYAAAQDNASIGNRLSSRTDVKGKWNYTAVRSLPEALAGCDFVIISIFPGTFEEMASDVHTPEKYGIYQAVGDTVGPGGLVRALRTVPMYVEIAEGIRDYAPEAWVINYTNPMTICTAALYEVFPKIKAFGCCHEVFGTQRLMVSMLAEMLGIEGVKRNEIKVNVLGINHFTWLDSASYKGLDLFPLYKAFVDKHYEEGFEARGTEYWKTDIFAAANRVKFDLFRRYGLIAAAGDRHLAEFMPPSYLKDPQTVAECKFSLTPVEWRVGHRKEQVLRNQRLAQGEEQVDLKPSGEEGVQQIKALLGLGELVTNVNLPNQGQMLGLPQGAVVETNAVFSRNSIKPVIAGQLPLGLHSLVARHVTNQQTVLQAALTKDKSLAFQAFINDPLVTLDVKDTESLFQQMLDNTKAYLPGWSI
ncbi:family 4 glycosyl hydrolase [Paenibacillus cremeus]|uniref:Alpha-glucosidase/alpha-galactosidase n=1 Tax=Paenibacillus cremeus TaxID=2163881 RepID=A0A559K7D7_9BACL|nr:alpha-glucosidase/alpha-galactosidase [Paenibacillus cremeus]TVY07993.1 alpha-glucosidase/alpha-galactosidase [Paenibacillus cremeus]